MEKSSIQKKKIQNKKKQTRQIFCNILQEP